ncbi:MAG: glycosyl hydrolase family 17 [Ekhidna sp.]
MDLRQNILACIVMISIAWSCGTAKKKDNMQSEKISAKEILGNSEYLAISYGGYRQDSRKIQPTIEQLKEDMKLLSAMGVRLLRTYNVQLPHATNVVKAISELKKEDPNFEMYVMLGAWIDCKNAWTDMEPDHNVESEQNADEIARAAEVAKKYPDIVKIIAVGNEAMVKWAASYYVQPGVILKWVKHLQKLKAKGELPKDLWITSSDDFSSWGGGDPEYHVEDLNQLIKAVDFISMHSYPMHNTHYNPEFWGVFDGEENLSKKEQIEAAMKRSLAFSKSQYDSVKNYMKSVGANKPIHIGETGWASMDNHLYGAEGSKATDEYKEGLYYKLVRDWTNENGITCFYFEAFDEPWKDAQNPEGSENFFGLFTNDGQAKFPLWSLVDSGVFEGLSRAGKTVEKTHNGDVEKLLEMSFDPPFKEKIEVAQ